MATTYGQGLGADNRLLLTIARKWGPQFYHYMELNSTSNKNELGIRLFLEATRQKLSPTNTLILTM